MATNNVPKMNEVRDYAGHLGLVVKGKTTKELVKAFKDQLNVKGVFNDIGRPLLQNVSGALGYRRSGKKTDLRKNIIAWLDSGEYGELERVPLPTPEADAETGTDDESGTDDETGNGGGGSWLSRRPWARNLLLILGITLIILFAFRAGSMTAEDWADGTTAVQAFFGVGDEVAVEVAGMAEEPVTGDPAQLQNDLDAAKAAELQAALASGDKDTIEIISTAEPGSEITIVETEVLTDTEQVTGDVAESVDYGELFSYTPGGEGFGEWATDVTHPEGYEEGSCGRVWQATNLVNLPWTAILCNWQTSEIEPKIQWPHPTQMTVSGSGILEFELYRDLAASSEVDPDPYEVALQGGEGGLGWNFQGFNGTVCVNGDCQELSGGGVYQLGFPHDMDGFYYVRIVVDNGQVNMWQGARVTSVDNWPLP